jgi:hypothetical protein
LAKTKIPFGNRNGSSIGRIKDCHYQNFLKFIDIIIFSSRGASGWIKAIVWWALSKFQDKLQKAPMIYRTMLDS